MSIFLKLHFIPPCYKESTQKENEGMLEERVTVKKEGEMKKAPCLSSNQKDNFIIELSEVVKKQMVWLLPNGTLLSASSSM